MNNGIKLGVAALAAVVVAGAAVDAHAWGRHHGGPMGMMGEGGPCGGERDRPLTAAQVKDIVEGQLAWRGEDLRVGAVAEKDGNLVAEVTRPDGEVVRRVAIDPRTGRFRRAE